MASNVKREIIHREYYPDTGQQTAAQGQKGDTQLAHVNPWEAALLKKLGGVGTVNPRTGLKQFYTAPTTWQAGQTNDTDWEKILSDYNTQHSALYGIPLNRPWNSDADTARDYAALSQKYNDVKNAAPPPTPAAAAPEPEPTYQSETSVGGGFNFDFPTNLMPTTYSGLPSGYRDDLLKTLMPQLSQSISLMPENIDKYVSEALSSYEQERQNAVRKNIPNALAQLANRGIISSTEAENILSKVYSDANTDASTKGYQTAMQAALLKANIPVVLGDIAKLGSYSDSQNPTAMYSIMANLLSAQF